jgi:hypothetical protein
MAESRRARRLFLPAVFFVALISALLPVTSAMASSRPLLVPNVLRLSGSNGYTIYVLASPPRAGRSGRVLIVASSKGKGATYSAPATVTETSIQADLGELGEISVTFQRTNEAVPARCGTRTIRFDSGGYEGTIDFRGEEGYTSVYATAVPGDADLQAAVLCSRLVAGGESGRYHGGAALVVRNPALGPRLSVRKSRPSGAAEITASTSEFTNGILIERFESLRIPTADFTYDRRLRTATVRPPAPFSGSAHFDLGKKAGQRWSGDLSVDLPGKSGVPLVGPTLRATLVPSR